MHDSAILEPIWDQGFFPMTGKASCFLLALIIYGKNKLRSWAQNYRCVHDYLLAHSAAVQFLDPSSRWNVAHMMLLVVGCARLLSSL